MPGHFTRRRIAAVLGAGTVAAIGALLVASAPAGASNTVKAQLSLSGVATQDNPTGGSVIGVHPGDTVVISASTVPTAGLDKLGLGDLVGNLLSTGATYQVTADLSGLPGGAKNTVLSGTTSKSFTFPKAGTYSFTWSAQSVGLLGAAPISLNGNQLAQAGIKLNAQNQYVGSIVVATNPPKGGIAVQLPSTSVQPQLPGVSLPKLGLPGVTTPTLPVTVPSAGAAKTSTVPKSGTTTQQQPTSVLPVPAYVVPKGTGVVEGSFPGYDGGATIPVGGTGSGQSASMPSIPVTTGSGSTGTSKTSPATRDAADHDVNLGAPTPASSGVPAILAVVAMIALAAVAGAYARLFLLRKN